MIIFENYMRLVSVLSESVHLCKRKKNLSNLGGYDNAYKIPEYNFHFQS